MKNPKSNSKFEVKLNQINTTSLMKRKRKKYYRKDGTCIEIYQLVVSAYQLMIFAFSELGTKRDKSFVFSLDLRSIPKISISKPVDRRIILPNHRHEFKIEFDLMQT